MKFDVGDLVTRNSHGNDIVFKVIEVTAEDIYILKGLNVRLYADSEKDDLVKIEKNDTQSEDMKLFERISKEISMDRSEYFYLPGKILHIDGDDDYLNRCLSFYKKANVLAYGIKVEEKNISTNIRKYIEDIKPDIIVITGHDAFYKNSSKYKNSTFFENAVRECRKYEKSYDKLIIIAGACQSNYDALIKAGANFASSPKRINIHALDPAIIALAVSLTDKSNDIDLIGILNKTKYGKEGMGGVKTKGMMYVGYPR